MRLLQSRLKYYVLYCSINLICFQLVEGLSCYQAWPAWDWPEWIEDRWDYKYCVIFADFVREGEGLKLTEYGFNGQKRNDNFSTCYMAGTHNKSAGLRDYGPVYDEEKTSSFVVENGALKEQFCHLTSFPKILYIQAFLGIQRGRLICYCNTSEICAASPSTFEQAKLFGNDFAEKKAAEILISWLISGRILTNATAVLADYMATTETTSTTEVTETVTWSTTITSTTVPITTTTQTTTSTAAATSETTSSAAVTSTTSSSPAMTMTATSHAPASTTFFEDFTTTAETVDEGGTLTAPTKHSTTKSFKGARTRVGDVELGSREFVMMGVGFIFLVLVGVIALMLMRIGMMERERRRDLEAALRNERREISKGSISKQKSKEKSSGTTSKGSGSADKISGSKESTSKDKTSGSKEIGSKEKVGKRKLGSKEKTTSKD